MNIVIEGPDGSGKTSLASALSDMTGRPIYKSRGHCKEGLLNRWYSDYEGKDGYIFDRHPCVGEFIYGRRLRGRLSHSPDDLEAERLFHASRPLIIYCDASDLLSHVADGITDDLEYLSRLSLANPQIIQDYRTWAAQCAHLIYNRHRYSEMGRIKFLVSRSLNYEGELTHV
jgi:hypothetical protein